MNNDELRLLFEIKEHQYLSTDKVVSFFIKLCEIQETNLELFYHLNKLFEEKGYGVRFVYRKSTSSQLDMKKYLTIISRIHTSKSKTRELIAYLRKVNNYKITMASLYLIRIDFLVDEGLLNIENNKYLKSCYFKKMNVDEALYKEYFSDNKEIADGISILKNNLIAVLGGFHDDYNVQYKHNEFLLYTNAIIYAAKNYKYMNSIKILFKISDKKYYDGYINKPYFASFEKGNESITYIKNKLIRKYNVNIIKKYIEKFAYESSYFDDGYSFFYKVIKNKYL